MPAFAPVSDLTPRAFARRGPSTLVRRVVPVKILSVSLLVLSLSVAHLFVACSPATAAAVASDVESEVESDVDPEAEVEPVLRTLFGQRVLLFMEHPPLVRGESARFLVHLTVLETGEPVRAGEVLLRVGETELAAPGPKRDGLFLPEGSFAEAGRWAGRLVITSEQVSETLDLGPLTVHDSQHQAATAAAAATKNESPGQVPFLMEQQWESGMQFARAGPQQLTRRLVVPARIALAEGAEAVLSSRVSGRLLAPPGGTLVRTGDVVEQGRELAIVEPPLNAGEAAQLGALELELELQTLAVERRLDEASTRLAFATIEHERVAQLVPKGLARRQELSLAQRDLELATGAQSRALQSRAALAELRSRRAMSHRGLADGVPRFSLPAPLSGVVVDGSWVVGESVEAGAELLRIVDPSRLWVEGRVSEFDLAQLSGAPSAQLTLPALPGLRIAVGSDPDGADPGLGAPVLGVEVELPSRTLSIRYELLAPDDNLRPGMLADLEIAVDVAAAEVAIPFAAVVIDQGSPTAYVMLEGELFQRRELVLGLRDGDLVEVLSGLAPDEHVVTRAAATLRLAALSPASFGHGHTH